MNEKNVSLLERLKFKALPGAKWAFRLAVAIVVAFPVYAGYLMVTESGAERTQALLNNFMLVETGVVVLSTVFYFWRLVESWKNSSYSFEFFEQKFPEITEKTLMAFDGNQKRAAGVLNKLLSTGGSEEPAEQDVYAGKKDPWEVNLLKKFNPKNPDNALWLNSSPPKEEDEESETEKDSLVDVVAKGESTFSRMPNTLMAISAGAILCILVLYFLSETFPAFLPLLGMGILVILAVAGLFLIWKFKRDAVKKAAKFATSRVFVGVLAAVLLIAVTYYFGPKIDTSKLSIPEGSGENSPDQAAVIPQNLTRGEAATTLQSDPYEYDPTMDEASLDLSEEAFTKGLLQLRAIVGKTNAAKEYMESTIPQLDESGDSFVDWSLMVSGKQGSSDGDKSGELSTGLASLDRFVQNWATKGAFVVRVADGVETKEYRPGGFSENLKEYLPEDSDEFVLLNTAKANMQEAAMLLHQMGVCLSGPAENQPPANWNSCAELEASYNALVADFGDMVDVLMSYVPHPPEGEAETGALLEKLSGFNGFVTALRAHAEKENVETVYITATPPPYSQVSYNPNSSLPDLEGTAVAIAEQHSADETAAAMAKEEGSGQKEVNKEPTVVPTNTLQPQPPTAIPTATPIPSPTPVPIAELGINKLIPYMDGNGISFMSATGGCNVNGNPSGWPGGVTFVSGKFTAIVDLTPYDGLYDGTAGCPLTVSRGPGGKFEAPMPKQGILSFDHFRTFEEVAEDTPVPFPTLVGNPVIPLSEMYGFMEKYGIWDMEADKCSSLSAVEMYVGLDIGGYGNYVKVDFGPYSALYKGPCGADGVQPVRIRRTKPDQGLLDMWPWINVEGVWITPFEY